MVGDGSAHRALFADAAATAAAAAAAAPPSAKDW